jgi:hypothetical protein
MTNICLWRLFMIVRFYVNGRIIERAAKSPFPARKGGSHVMYKLALG